MSPYADDTLVEGLPPASLDDKEMALAFQRGEKDAYQAIHERYEERVHRVCRRMLGRREDAQEAAQETFIRVYTALGKFNGRYQLGAWITRIATNVCLDQIRARSRRPVDSVPIEDLELEVFAGDAADPETVTVRNAESRRVRKVLLGLPPMHRAAIVLRDFEGLSYAEVGVALGMTECQVKALIHRARKGFRRSWTPLAEALVPAKLLQRFRDVDVSVKEHVVTTAASQSAPVVSMCSGLLQQCGSFMVEKVAPLATTMILGGAALASPASPSSAPDPQPSGTPLAIGSVLDPAPAAPRAHDDKTATEAPATDAPAPSAPPTETPVALPPPSEDPSAAPSEAPAPASPPPPSGTMAPKESTTPPPPFLPAFYFQEGQSPTAKAPVAHTASVDCSKLTVSQTVTAEISDHEGSYPITAQLSTGSSFQITFTVRKKGFDVNYTGGGALISQSNTGNELRLTFNGRYGTGGSAAESAGLPLNGSIRVDLALDCSAQSVIAESVVLTTQ